MHVGSWTGHLSTAWRLLRRHARNAGLSPARLFSLAARIARLAQSGELFRILHRHEIHRDLYPGYEAWAKRDDQLASSAAAMAAQLADMQDAPRISVLLPIYNPDVRWLRRAIESVRLQQYSRWELCAVDDASTDPAIWPLLEDYARRDTRIVIRRSPANAGISAATNAALAMAGGSHVVFLDHDDEISPDALGLVARAFKENTGLRFLYSDEDRIDIDGRRYWPVFKPAWNPDLLLANNYVTHLMCVDTVLARELGGMRSEFDGAQDWDFALRATEHLPCEAIGHLPRILYHWRSTPGSTAIDIASKSYAHDAQRSTVEAALVRRARGETLSRARHCWRVHPSAPRERARVSVVVPSRDRKTMLERCLIEACATVDADRLSVEWVIVNNGSVESDAVAFLQNLATKPDTRVIEYPGPFNFARVVNAGVRAATGDIVVLLNNDTHGFAPGWLEELAGQAMRNEVGAVGALLLYRDGSIQHAGIIVGVNDTAEHIFRGFPADWSGINGRAQSIQDFSAVTGACLAVRRELFLQLNGLDERFALSCNDIDFCLRARALGYRVVFTPFAVLMHDESVTRGYGHDPEQQRRMAAELELLRERWRAWFEDDPAYNPNLARHGQPFAIGEPVAPLSCRPRVTRQMPAKSLA